MKKQAGFTLIETLMAMAIFTIGILALFGMQSAAITENLAANKITTGSAWASDQVERLISLDYNDPILSDDDGDGCNGLNDQISGNGTDADADGFIDGRNNASSPPYYNIYWNVAQDCTLTGIPMVGVPPQDVQRPKYLRIIVTVDRGSGEEQTAVFNYIKQNV